MTPDAVGDRLSTAAGQAEFLNAKIVKLLEDRYGVRLEGDPALEALTASLEDNPDLAQLRTAFESIPDLAGSFPDVADETLAALQNMFDAGNLPRDLQALVDAIARLNANIGAGLGGNFDQSG